MKVLRALVAVVLLCFIAIMVRVRLDEELSAPSVGADSPPDGIVQAGMTRSCPVPYGDTIITDDHLALSIVNVQRGSEALDVITKANMFNPLPVDGKEYLLITISSTYLGGDNDTKRVYRDYFRLVGDRGEIYRRVRIVGLADFNEVFAGGDTIGQVVFQVPPDERDMTLIYSGGGIRACYLSVEP